MQKTAYEMRISDWSSDVCSSDLIGHGHGAERVLALHRLVGEAVAGAAPAGALGVAALDDEAGDHAVEGELVVEAVAGVDHEVVDRVRRQARIEPHDDVALVGGDGDVEAGVRSEENTSELQSLMSISYAVFCL